MTAPTRLRRPRRDTQIKVRAILRAGETLFLRDGFAGTSVDAIALEANVSKRTVYNHFESKEKLFGAIIAELCAQVLPSSTIDVANDDVEENLARIGIVFLSNVHTVQQVQLLRTVITEARNLPEIGRAMFDGPVSASRRMIATYLRALTERGTVALGDPELAATLFMGMLKSDMQLKLLLNVEHPPDRAAIEATAREAARLFLHGASARRAAKLPRAALPAAAE